MLRAWLLLASILVFSAGTAPSSCAAPPAPTPPPERATPEPAPTEAPPPDPGGPVEAPELEPKPSPGETGVPTPDPSAPCCFTNPAWSGVCKVTPKHDETCASILAYLDNPRSTGQTYCDSTDLRSGWKSVACNDE